MTGNLDDTPTPMKARWMVWTDEEGQRGLSYARAGAVWFWSASGPRGHMSGAEHEAGEAVRRGHLAMLQLESAQQ